MILVVALPVWLVELENRGIYIILLSWLVYPTHHAYRPDAGQCIGCHCSNMYIRTCTSVLPWDLSSPDNEFSFGEPMYNYP